MSLTDYIKHYFSFPGILWFALIAAGILVLIHAAMLGLFGFGTGYLLRGNGVVNSLWIGHLFVILGLWILSVRRSIGASRGV